MGFIHEVDLGNNIIYKVIGVQSAAERFLELIPFLESDLDGDLDGQDLNNGLVDVPASSKLRVSVGVCP